jgi:hypothetical protein
MPRMAFLVAAVMLIPAPAMAHAPDAAPVAATVIYGPFFLLSMLMLTPPNSPSDFREINPRR